MLLLEPLSSGGAKSEINVSGKKGLSDLQLKQTQPASRERLPQSPDIQVRAHKPWTPNAYMYSSSSQARPTASWKMLFYGLNNHRRCH